MPVAESRIREIHDFVLHCFRKPSNFKSGNKGYPELIPEAMAGQSYGPRHLITRGPVPGHAVADAKDVKRFAPASPEKRKLREQARQTASVLIPKFRAKCGDDFFQYGQLMVDNGAVAGNCTDMVAVASWYATNMDIGVCWVAVIEDPGDHVFCVITDGDPPRWDCVGQYRRDRSGDWVIDPWANVYCRLRDYERDFRLKMDKWTQRGKRIRYKSRVLRVDGWAVPNSLAYLNGFLMGDLLYFTVTE